MSDILSIRRRATFALSMFILAHVPVVGATAFLLGRDAIWPTLATAVAAAIVVAFARLQPDAPATRYLIAAVMMGIVSMMVALFWGNSWQIDMHMYYFAALAILAPMVCTVSILVAAVVVAVHHLTLSFLLPAAVFPDDASLGRVILHAVIVVIEAGALLWVTHSIQRAFDASTRALKEVELAQAEQARLAEQTRERDRQAATEKTAALVTLSDSLKQTVGGIADTVAAASEELSRTATSLTETTGRVGDHAGTVARDATENQARAQAAADALDRVSQSIARITDQVSLSSRITGEAVQRAADTDRTVAGLAQATDRIGEVLTLIQDIAEQTNLLALNATIEAARAGDAGKGFAVVASEVKNLAGQTAKATETIAGEISSIQAESRGAVEAIRGIGETVGRIDEVARTIADAVGEQEATARELGDEVAAMSQSATQAASGVTEMADQARDGSKAASDVLSASQDLAVNADTLQREITEFCARVRAG
ncbi:methyl-accepting chemotaxis protein [Thalassobaculum litoreum]|uniref:Methyl-accepting chemotaxis protein n=1 Tax=Thalassobaculum litoreum DSM 18839 TaxID=1123362 RepID=A0A8G2EYC4_9PROT|nr:methyl-accepting chemotaxis protein [Thalassobaculum litoreum]SDF76760.1 methyl-accepting chemotaxis protein [Thalassobaculum litoreum DSM 18839]